jgi:hypothetical protein
MKIIIKNISLDAARNITTAGCGEKENECEKEENVITRKKNRLNYFFLLFPFYNFASFAPRVTNFLHFRPPIPVPFLLGSSVLFILRQMGKQFS